jgi:hypothetical protein
MKSSIFLMTCRYWSWLCLWIGWSICREVVQVVRGWFLNLPWTWGSYGRLGEELEGHLCMINVFWVRRRRYIAGVYRDNLRDTAAWQGPMLCIIYHYHYHYRTNVQRAGSRLQLAQPGSALLPRSYSTENRDRRRVGIAINSRTSKQKDYRRIKNPIT